MAAFSEMSCHWAILAFAYVRNDVTYSYSRSSENLRRFQTRLSRDGIRPFVSAGRAWPFCFKTVLSLDEMDLFQGWRSCHVTWATTHYPQCCMYIRVNKHQGFVVRRIQDRYYTFLFHIAILWTGSDTTNAFFTRSNYEPVRGWSWCAKTNVVPVDLRMDGHVPNLSLTDTWKDLEAAIAGCEVLLCERSNFRGAIDTWCTTLPRNKNLDTVNVRLSTTRPRED